MKRFLRFLGRLLERLGQHSAPEYAGPLYTDASPEYNKASFRVGPAFSCDEINQFVWPLDGWSRKVIMQEIEKLNIAWEFEETKFYAMTAPPKIRIPDIEQYRILTKHLSSMSLTLEEVEKRK